jgi:hypothetical protein
MRQALESTSCEPQSYAYSYPPPALTQVKPTRYVFVIECGKRCPGVRAYHPPTPGEQEGG